MDPSFQAIGNLPVDSDRLKILLRGYAMLRAVDFNIRVDTPSGPFAFVWSSLNNITAMSSSEHKSSSGTSDWGGTTIGLMLSSGGRTVF